jgi:succinate dehydrogenase / fumarate reductase cytochrome b subunit
MSARRRAWPSLREHDHEVFMSTVATSPAAPPKRAARTRLQRLLTSTIGLKIIMAATGVILTLFVLGHMVGNLQVFQGAESINAYGKLLHKEPAILWTARLVLLSAVALHIWAFVVLFRKNQEARAVGYRVVARRESSFASRSMRYTGPLILAFIVYHILHMTTGTVHPAFHEGDVYGNLVSGLRVVPVALIYVLAMLGLGFHLWHGVWSMFQTLGVSQPRYDSLGRRVATAVTVLVVAGFSAVPLAALAGLIK